jgi:uncharacterized protein (UPF0332 family)
MSQDAADLWSRAVRPLVSAAKLTDDDPDSAASRAYYAAFYAVSALFTLQDRTFTKHRAVETAVHRDLVNQKLWSTDLGEAFSELVRLRRTGDYGGRIHVPSDEAEAAVNKARRILQAVHDASPQDFPKLDDTP